MTKSQNLLLLDNTARKNVETWLNGHYDQETKNSIEILLEKDPKAVNEAFYTALSFGTGGLRGIMGVGTNRMNAYTVSAATQGLANYINSQPKDKEKHSVLIGYDSRHHSRSFAEECAKVLAGNNIQVYLSSELRPAPWVSFGCRLKKCTSAIMITASHNPPEYNGYKVYWNDGGQVVPPHDQAIIGEVNKIVDVSQVKKSQNIKDPLIVEIDEEIDQSYLKAISSYQHYPKENQQFGNQLKIAYTSLHGTGITLIPQALKEWGFSNLVFVESQVIPDGNFPTTKTPNPEEKEALKLGIETMQKEGADILLATDPDADRMAVVVNHEGSIQFLNGNQIASLCLHHLCEALTEQNRMPEKGAFIKTIVTSEMLSAIATSYKKSCFNVLTGFKYIAEKIRQWEENPNGYQYLFGGEESYGYLMGTYTRDKDAISTSCLISEIALQAKLKGKSLIDLLNDLYEKYGVHLEKLFSLKFQETKEGREEMKKAMATLRLSPPTSLNGVEIIVFEDYLSSQRKDFKQNKTETIDLPKSDVLLFWLADGTKAVIRPSGTEPKVKIYCGVVKKEFTSLNEAIQGCEEKAEKTLESLKALLKSKAT